MDIENLISKAGWRNGLRENTIKTYASVLGKFFRTYRKEPFAVKKKDIEKHLENLHKLKRSDNTINVHLNALKFFYEKVLNRKLTVNIKHIRQRKKLPQFLTQQEIKKLFSVIKNEKHQLMIKFLYATGMRISEFTNLKVKDFQFDANYGWIREGKGGKDRLFIVSSKLKQEICNWIAKNKLSSNNFLFTGYNEKSISASTIRLILIKAAKMANIKKDVHPHMLRHSFATHLIENGYGVNELQPLLGHSSLDTTMIYVHLAAPQLLKVKSPYDKL